MNDTPVYIEALNAAVDHAIEVGRDEDLDYLAKMDQDTRPTTPA